MVENNATMSARREILRWLPWWPTGDQATSGTRACRGEREEHPGTPRASMKQDQTPGAREQQDGDCTERALGPRDGGSGGDQAMRQRAHRR